MDSVEFGKYLATLRKAKGWTQEKLAEQIHVSNKTISKWETGVGLPDIRMLEPLAEALGVTVLELIKSKETKEMNTDEIEDTISDVIEIAEHQRQLERKNFVIMLVAAMLLISMILILDLLGADIFFTVYLPFVFFAMGVVLIAYALRMRKRHRKYKKLLVIGIIGLVAPLMPTLFIIGCLCLLKLKDLGIL